MGFIIDLISQDDPNLANKISSIPGAEISLGYSLDAIYRDSYAAEQDGLSYSGPDLLQIAKDIASNPVGFVKNQMQESGFNYAFNGSINLNDPLLKEETKYLKDNGVASNEIQSLFKTGLDDGTNALAYDKSLTNNNSLASFYGLVAAVFLPAAGAAIASALVDAGVVTGAAEAAAAATAAGATAAEVTAAAAAATSTATQIGTAIASVSVQVAQGVPIQDAVMNAAISTVVQTGSTDVAKTIVAAGSDPAVANAIASVGGSIAKTAASGGDGTDILNNAIGALAGSGVTTLTADELGTAASRAVGAAVGTAAAGGDTSKVLGAAAGSLGKTDAATGTAAANTSGTSASDTTASQNDATTQQLINAIANAPDLSQNPSVQVAGQTVMPDASGGYFDNQGRWHADLTGMAVPDKLSTETGGTASETTPGGVAGGLQTAVSGTGEAINIDPNAVINPSTDNTVKTVDLTQGTGGADTSGQTAITANDQQILNLIGTDTATTGGANAAVINPATISTTGAGANVADANVASTTATTDVPAAREEVVVTADKPVVPDANVSTTIVDTSSRPLIDATTSLANAAGQGADTVTVTADKPASNVSTGDQQIIDLISSDTSKTADTGTAVTDAGTVNVTAGRENVAAPTIIDVVSPEPAPAPAPEPAPADKVEEVVVTAKKDNVSPTIIDTVETPAAKTEPVAVDKTAAAEDAVAKDAVPFKPELFIFGGTAPKGRKSSALSQTINAPFYPSTGLTQALTASRPAGEIEGDPTGKKRQNVWNEASLRLKDALGL